MSTILNSFARPSTQKRAKSRNTPARVSVRGLSVLLLAALVSGLAIVADRYISVWTDGHLFFGWVVLWAVVFAGMALFASTARKVAKRAMRALDSWSRSMAKSRADARLWEIAQSDPRVMAELTLARMSDEEGEQDFESALAPMGMEPEQAVDKSSYSAGSRLVSARSPSGAPLHYV